MHLKPFSRVCRFFQRDYASQSIVGIGAWSYVEEARTTGVEEMQASPYFVSYAKILMDE
jgi:hypothetical protein